jgi:hypothetical protein
MGSHYATAPAAAMQHRRLLQKRNSKFFSLEYWSFVAIIRDATASNKTDIYGHKSQSCLFSPWLRINHLTWGSNESAQQ